MLYTGRCKGRQNPRCSCVARLMATPPDIPRLIGVIMNEIGQESLCNHSRRFGHELELYISLGYGDEQMVLG